MPTVCRHGNYRFFFNSREETRRHIHIDLPGGTAKYWLEPAVELAMKYQVKEKELSTLEKIVREKKDEFIEAWNKHFGV